MSESNNTFPVNGTIAEKAAFYSVSPKTIDNWTAAGAPMHDPHALRKWARGHNGLRPAFHRRIRELTGELDADGGDPDWISFQEKQAARRQNKEDPKEALAEMLEARDFASFKFKKKAESGDQDEIKFYTDLLVKLEGAIHDAQLRAKKLGLDNAELFPRQEIERILRVLGFWLIRACDESIASMLPKLCAAAAKGQLSRDDAKKILESELLSARVVVPLKRACAMESGVTLPDWVVASINKGIADVIESA